MFKNYFIILIVFFANISGAEVNFCKITDENGKEQFFSCTTIIHGNSFDICKFNEKYYECEIFPKKYSKNYIPQSTILGVPSILPQCLDADTEALFAGPSVQARECTRLYCSKPEYLSKIEAYALKKPQSKSDQNYALICIERKEQDQEP